MRSENFSILCAEAHHAVSYRANADYGFARRALIAPVGLHEIAYVTRHYPVLFAGKSALQPVAVMAFDGHNNVFVDRNGAWSRNHYIPEFFQLHPFSLVELPQQDNAVIVFDKTSSRLKHAVQSSEQGRLFTDEGSPTPLLQGICNRLVGFREEMFKARRFVQALDEADLLMPNALSLKNHDDPDAPATQFYAINEAAYRSLSSGLIEKWFREGWLDLLSLILATNTITTQILSGVARHGALR